MRHDIWYQTRKRWSCVEKKQAENRKIERIRENEEEIELFVDYKRTNRFGCAYEAGIS